MEVLQLTSKRVTTKTNNDTDRLYNRMRFLKGKEDNESKTELEAVKKAIAEIAENSFNKLKQQLEKKKLDDNMINAHEIWKLRKKMSPKNCDPPTAMTDKKRQPSHIR